jgi:hypothetical protein
MAVFRTLAQPEDGWSNQSLLQTEASNYYACLDRQVAGVIGDLARSFVSEFYGREEKGKSEALPSKP